MSSTSVATATPQRKLPGGYVQTPAAQRVTQPSIFRSNSSSALVLQKSSTSSDLNGSTALKKQSSNTTETSTKDTSPIILGSRTINEALAGDGRYPDLESYVGQGYSAEYDLLENSAWAPFQKVKNYEIPEQIFEQANQSQIATTLGLFAEINHAYIAIDSSLYLWDYTHPTPELIGFEESNYLITAVTLAKPRAGVFVPSITHLLVVATQVEILLIGISTKDNQAGGKAVELYSTRMSVPIKGISCSQIVASGTTGRIFFCGRTNTDVWEMTYQQEERWFKSRCDKINHTGSTYALTGALSFFSGATQAEYIKQIAIDDTRDLLYTLSTNSTIRVYHMKNGNALTCALVRPFSALLSNIGHMVPRTDLLMPSTEVVSISPIPAKESSRLSLQLLTSTGCRLYLSATSGSYYPNSNSSAPTSMQVHHVKFPPKDPNGSGQTPQPGNNLIPFTPGHVPVETNSTSLSQTILGCRQAPGFTLVVVKDPSRPQSERIFLSAPDSGQIKLPKDPSQPTKFPETAQWMQFDMPVQDIERATPPFSAANGPLGFANELAVQYDATPTEIAILTSSGIHTIRRRRLVDILAAAIRYGGDNDGREGEMKKFIRLYGRSEAASAALAVACGQGSDVTSDERVAQITDPEVVDFAREMFIQHGGRATFNENSVLDNAALAADNVRTSPRHEGISLYLSRIVRSIWKAPVCIETPMPAGGLHIGPGCAITKLQGIQRSLNSLQEFLSKNKSSIEGLAGPDALRRVSTKQEEVTLQVEHRAMNSLVQLIANMIEGIAFVLVLFDEKLDEIMTSLPEESRTRVKHLTFERLFSATDARELAKELVRAIVNRNIAKGANVDTVADALRRRCGSFCSADDVVIFKAQEQVKRASEASSNSEQGRALLNESLRLFKKVAGTLPMEHLHGAVDKYISLQFYAGAIQLCLSVAQESDRANRAISWLRDDAPADDPRKVIYDTRKKTYDLIFDVLAALDNAMNDQNTINNDLFRTRRMEAYDVVDNSQDEVFQITLFDHYLNNGQASRLLDVSSAFVVPYLKRKMTHSPEAADLLWKYHSQHSSFLEAASVQLQLARSNFTFPIATRIEYLSSARASASIRSASSLINTTSTTQSRHSLQREISDLLDVAVIQDDILQRMKSDPRLTETRRPQVLKQLDGEILPIDELFNQYADQAGYYDICICIYAVADHRNASDITSTWQALIEQLHAEATSASNNSSEKSSTKSKNTSSNVSVAPWESISSKVRTLGSRLRLSESIFPVPILVPMLERYAIEFQATGTSGAPEHWVSDLFIELEVPFDVLVGVLEGMWHASEAPFVEKKARSSLGGEMVNVMTRWSVEGEKTGHGLGEMFGGGDDVIVGVEELIGLLIKSGDLSVDSKAEVERLRGRIAIARR